MAAWHEVRGTLSQIGLFFLIMGMAGTIDLASFRRQLLNVRSVATGVLCQFVLLPFCGFVAVRVAGLGYLDGIMLLLVTSSPGGGFSGLLCSLSNASVALSVAMTTVSTLLSFVALPFNMFLYLNLAYGAEAKLNYLDLAVAIAIVIAAVAVGLALGTWQPEWRTAMNRAGSCAGLMNIILSILPGGIDATGPTLPPDQLPERDALWFFSIMSPCVLGLVVSFAVARGLLHIDPPEAVAIGIECCYQNTGLATTVALTVFTPAESEVAKIVPLVYGAAELLSISIFGLVAWKLGWTYVPPSMPFGACLFGNHQPSGDELARRMDKQGNGPDGSIDGSEGSVECAAPPFDAASETQQPGFGATSS